MKECSKCHTEKPVSDFYKKRTAKDGLHSWCKACDDAYARSSSKRKESLQKYWKSDRYKAKRKTAHHKAVRKLYRQTEKNTEYRKTYNAEYRNRRNLLLKSEEHRRWAREYARRKKQTDIHYRLTVTLRGRFISAVKRGSKSGSAVRDLGCSIPELRSYLEEKFQGGMSWDNHGQWHIDHITPLAMFDLANREQFLQAVHYTNLQPLWAKENWTKGARVDNPVH